MPQDTGQLDLQLASSVDSLPGVSQKRSRLLHRLGIRTVRDLIRHFPLRYEHESAEDTIDKLQVDTVGSTRGQLTAARWIPARGPGRKGRFEATLEDPTARLALVWFNASYLRNKLHPGMNLRVQGKVKKFGAYMQLANPKWEVLDEDAAAPTKSEKLRPIYPATEDLSSHQIEQFIERVLPAVLPQIPDPLPQPLLDHHAMPPLADAFRMIHQPAHEEEAAAARRRLAFNELFLLQLGIALKRSYVHQKLAAPALKHNDAIDAHIRSRFPFDLTPAQEKVLAEIAADLTRTEPMNRLLQGDVGSGKTVVALYALLMAVADGRQAALLAPTELLAEQHLLSISDMLADSQVRMALLTGSQPPVNTDPRRALLAQIETGQVDLVVGTHALLSESVRFHDLAVVVIDEQHRFGVQQRAALRKPADSADSKSDLPATKSTVPHHLVMTATPIPRTLSLTVFGDLDVSTINQLPPGRTPVANRVVPPDRADEVYDYLKTRLQRGQQAYVVVPAVDATGHETSAQLKSVREHADLLQQKLGDEFRVAAVHGRLKRNTRENIMDRFRRGKIHCLVATTVIEVGVDVPNATVMVIEHAERFGLAQLHQLRGRVGRSSDGTRSLCVFIADPNTHDAQQRINAIASTNDGFRVAEHDLQIRGMGDFFGTRQSGLPPLRVAQIPDDMDLLLLARRDAQQLIDRDPVLTDPAHQPLRRILLQQYGQALGLIDVA